MTASATPESPPDAPMLEAIAHHQAKRFAEAEAAYLAIVAARPYHPLANHNLGLLAGQQGNHAAALPYLYKALSADPDEGQFWLSYASGLLKAGQPAQALDIMDTAVGRGLDNPAALALQQQAREAVAALARQPGPDETGPVVALYQSGDYAALERATRALIDKYPESGFAWSVLGTALALQGKDALETLRKTVEVAPQDAEAHGNLGNALQGIGEFEQALDSYARALAIAPGFVEAYGNRGGALLSLGRYAEAEASYRQAIALRPDYAAAHFNLGNTLQQQQRLEEAAASYRQARELVPQDLEALLQLGSTLKQLGRNDEAAACFEELVRTEGMPTDVIITLANNLGAVGHLDAALRAYRQVLAAEPEHFEAARMLGLTLMHAKDFQGALDTLQQSLARHPDSALLHTELGNAFNAMRRFQEAAECHLAALTIDPEFALAHSNLGAVQQALGRLDAAEQSCRAALALEPDLLVAHKNLCSTLQIMGRKVEALAACRTALALAPDDPVNLFNLSNSLYQAGAIKDAVAALLQLVALYPDVPHPYVNLGAWQLELGQVEVSIASSRKALALAPELTSAYSNMLFALSHSTEISAAALFEEHRGYGERYETPLRALWPQHEELDPDPDRPLRVGFVSADFFQHAVSNFFTPVLELLSTYPQLILFGYYNKAEADSTTATIRQMMAHWREVHHLNDTDLAQLIRDDGIDILIDLSGHTAGNRLTALALKPAPLQASWLGYPGSTGLQAVDYYLSDNRRLPPGKYDAQFLEHLVRIPLSTPFTTERHPPPVSPLPALANGYLTFGSFNRPSKLSPAVIALWAQLLRALPTSKMLLGGLVSEEDNQTMLDWFAAEGIAADRLALHQRTPMGQYLKLHQQIDICLNPFPYTGATTLCHALLMGVPTLTTTGPSVPSHAGAAFLAHVGLDAFIAHNAAMFVEKGVFLSQNLDALAELRAGMRARFDRSPVGQAVVTALGLERAFRIMWQRRCAGLPTAPFTIGIRDIATVVNEEDAA